MPHAPARRAVRPDPVRRLTPHGIDWAALTGDTDENTGLIHGLHRAGIRIGRDHIASVVNTLVLAYAGAALPLLLLFSIAQSSVGTVANSELVAEEIVRTLVGSIGLVASVPVTTALAALVVSADRPGYRRAVDEAGLGPAGRATGRRRGRRRKP